MSAYPNFWAPQQTTNQYQSAGQPMQNPYIDRMNQMQQYQKGLQSQPPQFPMIIGRVVNDFSEIMENEIPANGNAAFFPKADGSELQVKAWSFGTIQTVIYRPIFEQNSASGANVSQMDFNALNEDVRALREEITARFDKLEQSIIKPSSARGKKTEVSADE